jgi:hypothetical protein
MRLRPGIIGVVSVVGVRLVMGQALAPAPVSAPPLEPFAVVSPEAAANGPRIQFAELAHDFGEMQAGETIKHTFVYTNTGLATLEILQIRPSCGCTTAGEWDKRVEPGATGRIPIEFSSASFSGPIQKTVSVISNDPQQNMVILNLKANVWVPLEVTPKTVMFQYDSDAPVEATQTIRIISNLKEPLRLLEPRIGHPAFRTELQTVKEGKEYALLVSTVPPIGTGMIASPFFIQPSDTNVQPVRVQAYAVERKPIVVSPSQLMLPTGRTAAEMRPSLTIRAQSTNLLELSEATINVPGVTVEVKELQPGRLFALTPTFPAGFELPAGQRVEVTVKSNHPRHPLIRVPVVQTRQVARGPVQTTSGRSLPVRTNLPTRVVPTR